MSHNFLKYAPLRMKLRNIENPSSSGILSNENLVGNSRHFASMFRDVQAQAASHSRAEVSNFATHQTLHEENSKEENDGISIENINIWFQRQERRTSELQIQLDSSITENNRLKISLEKSHKEIQNLQNINKTLQDSHITIRAAVKNAEKLFAEVNDNVSSARQILEQVKQDRETWLSNLKECQRSHFDRRVLLVHSDYQKSISEKDSELASKQSVLNVLEAELGCSVAKVDSLQHELLALKNELEETLKDKHQLIEEKQQLEAECKKLNQGLDEILNEKTAEVIEELSKEKERCALTANDLKDCQEKLTTAESRLDVVIKELHHIKDEERKEPKEKLRAEVSSLKSEILELSNAIIGFKKTISILQEDLLVAQEANRRLDEANKSLPLLSKERAALQEKFVSLESQAGSLTAMLTEASTERNLYKGMIEERDAKLLHSSNLNADLEEKVQILTSGNSELKAKMSLIENENRELTDRVVSAEENSKKFQDMAEERARTLDKTMSDFEESQKSLNDAKKEILDLKRELMGCHLKLDYANERLNQMENEENVKHKMDRCHETSSTSTRPSKFAIDVDLNPTGCSNSTESERASQYSNDFFAKPKQRASVHEFPPKSKEQAKGKEASAKLTRSLNPLELLEKADAIVAKGKVHHGDDNTASSRKVLALSDSEIWKHHQKKQRIEHDVTTGQWECPAAPSPVIKTNWKY